MVKIKVSDTKRVTRRRATRVTNSESGVKENTFSISFILRHLKLLLWPGSLWLVFAVSVLLIPYLSVVFTKQLAFLIVVSALVLILPLVFLRKHRVVLYKMPLTNLVLAFLAFVTFVAWFKGLFNYNFWDLGLFVDLHPYVLIGGALGILALVLLTVQFSAQTTKLFLMVLPCLVIILDFLGIFLKLTAGLFVKILSALSVKLGQMYLVYLQGYGALSLYPDSNFWLLAHLTSILFLVVLMLKDNNKKNTPALWSRAVMLVIILWFLTYPITAITFGFVWGVLLFVLGIAYVAKIKFGLKQSILASLGVLALMGIFMLVQVLFFHKKLFFAPGFLRNVNLFVAYRTYDRAIRAHEFLPGIFRGNILQNLVLGLSVGKLGPLMGILGFVLAKVVYNGLVVLLVETGILGGLFWAAIAFLLFKKLHVSQNTASRLSVVAALLVMLWQMFSGVSVWSLFFLYLLIFVADVLTTDKVQEIKLNVNEPLAYALRFAFYTIAVLGTLLWTFVVVKTGYITKGLYAIKLRQVEAASQKGAQRFKTLEEAYLYIQQTRAYCSNCRTLDIASLQVLDQLDVMLLSDKTLVKNLKIDPLFVEQLRNYLLTGAYKLVGETMIPDANTITASVFDRLGIQQKSKLLQSLAIAKYEQAVNLIPTDYNLMYKYARLLLLQQSKKNDATYARLVSLLKLLASQAGNSPTRIAEVALLQGQFYTKYKEYDKAKDVYSKVKQWLSGQKFKDEKQKKAWLDLMDRLIKNVEHLQNSQGEKPGKGTSVKENKE